MNTKIISKRTRRRAYKLLVHFLMRACHEKNEPEQIKIIAWMAKWGCEAYK